MQGKDLKDHERRSRTVRLNASGRITLPRPFREALGLRPGDDVYVTLAGDKLHVSRARPPVGSPWLKQLYELFAPARESLRGYTEQEINDAIDEAVREVRAEETRKRETAG